MLKKNIKKNLNFENLLLFVLLLFSLYVRVFRINSLLGFYYDQGRDASVIWDFIYKGKFFLIGPTTGIEGIFRGPWYYWLIAPFYFFGNGNPVYPSIFLSITTVISIYLLYLLSKEISGKVTGFIAVIIASFSSNLVYSSRWLSNPTPMFLISMVFVWSLLLILKKKKWSFPLATFLIGMAMQFGSAAEVFYIPAFIIFCVWQRKKLPKLKYILLGLLMFGLVFLPQIIFDLRHNFILSKNIIDFVILEKSFKLSFWEIAKVRIPFYYDVFTSKIWAERKLFEILLMLLGVISLVFNWKKLWKKDLFRIVLLFLMSPIIGMFFFQGNYGNVYDYYFTGYYLVFVLFFSVVISSWSRKLLGKLFLGIFLISFLLSNLPKLRYYLISGTDGPETIAFENQKQSIDWVYKDADKKEFNVDVYVPPVIPHAYNYLFLWLGETKYGYFPKDENIKLLYTLYEVDTPHPERLEKWLQRQEGIGKIIEQQKFGGITVQRRERI